MERATIQKQRFFIAAVIIAILNPILPGLILGMVMLKEPDLRKEGRIVLAFSLVWGFIALLLVGKFRHLLL
ncbi:MAG: hypothetical protein A3A44_02315 [Candidatus Sungbacteria bacterium RIFCSPLOWO2_01_FULL_60_25]|uniref:Uncharacterized protein n=1 Tax=Candidatus Sungbacteria bacterium RIFCSPLOWO2_01_FULL_60_25 TaxID=1802281 RepID=A0A1G2LFN5_9BACT|nr:MAG: hypothetical protein A3A44_02315 [Candidatus Sungbacteria bacterium RIFCSPLOWO2_01_FULL_60_25]